METPQPIARSPSPGARSLRRIAGYDGPNPFEPQLEYSSAEKLKVFLFTITLLAPIRFILCLLLVVIAIIFAFVATVGHPLDEPLPKWRWVIAQPVRYLLRCVLFLCGFWVLDVNYLFGSQPEQARIIVANHISVFDGLVLLYLIESCVVCKAPLLTAPVVGFILRAFQALGVGRDGRSERQKSTEALKQRALDTRYPPLVIFPEGTTHSANTMIMFKRGAFTPGLPVQPVTLNYTNKVADLSYVENGGLWYFYYACCQFANFVTVDFLPLHIPSDEEQTNSMVYAGNVRRIMAHHLEITPTDHSYNDIRLAMLAKGHPSSPRRRKSFYTYTTTNENLPRDVPQYPSDFANSIVVSDISLSLGLPSAQVMKLGKIFVELDDDGRGIITYERFCQKMGIDTSSAAGQRLFHVFDTDENYAIGFSEFLMAMAAVIDPGSIEDAVLIMFEVCDWNGSGTVRREDLKNVASNWELSNITMRMTNLNAALFDSGGDEELDFETFRERALKHPEKVRGFLQFLLHQRLNVDLDAVLQSE